MDWIHPLQSKIISTLAHSHELPNYLCYYTPDLMRYYETYYLDKIIPSEHNKILHTQVDVLNSGADNLQQIVQNFDSVFVFDLASTLGDSSLPLIYPLLQQGILDIYCTITPSRIMNHYAAKRLKAFSIHSHFNLFDSHGIVCELENQHCKEAALEVKKTHSTHSAVSLFLLLDSRLGNSPQPEEFLTNIYDTMSEGDILCIVQSIYRDNIEEELTKEYTSFLTNSNSFTPTKELISFVEGTGNYTVVWDDAHVHPSVLIQTAITQPHSISGYQFDEGDIITAFRSNRFHREWIENISKKIGFSISNILFDSNDDTALFILKK